MKSQLVKLLIFLIFIFCTSLKSAATVLISSIPYVIEITKQVILSLGLIAGYLVNIKPEFPSKADQSSYQTDGIQSSFLQQFLNDVSKQAGVKITPEILSQLKNAGMHHDYQKLENLFSNLEKITKNSTPIAQNIEINAYICTQGIKKFQQPGAYQEISSINMLSHEPAVMGIPTCTTASQKKDAALQLKNPALSDKNEHIYSCEFTTKTEVLNAHQIVLSSNTHESAKTFNTSQYIHHMMQQQFAYSQGKALHEWQAAYSSVIEHFHTPSLRNQLKKTLYCYQKVIHDACQIGGTPQALHAQTQIALQGLTLPGFLNEFSEVLQDKILKACFSPSGDWKGIETKAQLHEIQQAFKSYQNLIDSLSSHLEWGNPSRAQECIEELYLMDQGRDSWASRFFTWMNNLFDCQALSLDQMQSRIIQSSFNQHALTALELLENNQLKLARIPLENMARSAKTANSVLLNQSMLTQYQQKIAAHYGTAHISFKYQNDPVFWLYKPSAAQMGLDDPALELIEGHLALRDTIHNQILKAIGKPQTSNPLIRHLAYTLIDKLDDPIAFIEQLEFLSSDSQSPEIQQACAVFFDKGILNLFGLKKQATYYKVAVSDILNRSEHATMRTALNKLLLVDARSENSKRSIKLVFDCLPHACSTNNFSKDYQNIIQAIAQAHLDAKAPKEILHIGCFPINPSSPLQTMLLKAMGKAASEDINPSQHLQSNPLTTRQAWACIKQIQDLENEGKTAEAQAISNTYLRGYLDEKMPTTQYIRPIIIATTAIAGTWYTNSQEQPSKIVPQSPFKTPSTVSDEDSEEIKKYKSILEEILGKATKGNKTMGKAKIFEKEGGLEEAIKDFEKLNPKNVRDIPGKGKIGELPDGKRINVRNTSDNKLPTLEIFNPTNRSSIKIRYL